jgi:hypothetical protein
MDFGFDDIIDSILDIPDTIMDLPDIISESFSTIFDNISEFSITGLVFGIISAGIIFLLKNYLLNPFLKYMNPIEAVFWGIGTYIACFVGGYLMGTYFENS